MGSYVSCQVCFSLEALCAVSKGADKAPAGAMGAWLCFCPHSGCLSSGSLGMTAARKQASGAKVLSSRGAPAPVCLLPATVMARDGMPYPACAPVPASRRFSGWCPVDGRCWCDKVRDRGVEHGQCRSGYQRVTGQRPHRHRRSVIALVWLDTLCRACQQLSLTGRSGRPARGPCQAAGTGVIVPVAARARSKSLAVLS